MAKRLFDVTLSLLLVIVLAPAIVFVAIMVAVEDGLPVIFVQERVGRGGVPFRMFKFRSMRMQQASGPLITRAGDPRITGVGKFLRRTKLDEVPQLWNVLRGEMSIVGPRPEVPRYFALYPAELRAQLASLRPGLTDEAAIEFRHEESILAAAIDPERTYVEQLLPRKWQLYSAYAQRHSVAGDLRILGRTVWALVAKRA
jgi:lipopolysaccharide/colanic/teichoic acid biosynthesis glycosyltransferase